MNVIEPTQSFEPELKSLEGVVIVFRGPYHKLNQREKHGFNGRGEYKKQQQTLSFNMHHKLKELGILINNQSVAYRHRSGFSTGERADEKSCPYVDVILQTFGRSSSTRTVAEAMLFQLRESSVLLCNSVSKCHVDHEIYFFTVIPFTITFLVVSSQPPESFYFGE